jgi:hypothetical protein
LSSSTKYCLSLTCQAQHNSKSVKLPFTLTPESIITTYKGRVMADIKDNVPFKGNEKLLYGIIFGVITFWLFAQTILNVAPVMSKDLGTEASVMNIAISIT